MLINSRVMVGRAGNELDPSVRDFSCRSNAIPTYLDRIYDTKCIKWFFHEIFVRKCIILVLFLLSLATNEVLV